MNPMNRLSQAINKLRAVTHGTCANHSAGAASSQIASAETDFTKHGTDPDWQRCEIAKAEAQDAAILLKMQFNEDCG